MPVIESVVTKLENLGPPQVVFGSGLAFVTVYVSILMPSVYWPMWLVSNATSDALGVKNWTQEPGFAKEDQLERIAVIGVAVPIFSALCLVEYFFRKKKEREKGRYWRDERRSPRYAG